MRANVWTSVALTSIPLDSAVRDRLKRYGTMGMSYNEIVTRLMDEAELDKFLRDLIRVADDTKTKWVRHEDLKWD